MIFLVTIELINGKISVMKKYLFDRNEKAGSFISANIKKLLERTGISVHQLSIGTNLSYPTVKRILENDDPNPTLNSVETIANYFKVTIAELLGEVPSDFSSHPNFLKRTNLTLIPLLKDTDIIEWPKNKAAILNDETISSVSTDSNVGVNAYAMIANINSMEPAIPEKSILIIDPDGELKNKSFVIILKNGTHLAQIKQLLLDGPDRYIRTLNPEISMTSNKPIFLNEDEYQILGVIKEVISKF